MAVIPNRTGGKVSESRPSNLRRMGIFREIVLATGKNASTVPTSPTISVGSGAPTHTRPDGSMYLRTDGDGETALYCRANSLWLASGTGGALEVINNTGGTLAKGECVYVSGFDSADAVLEVTEADADDPAKAATHVVLADISDGDTGQVDTIAYVTGIDTTGIAAVGDPMYLSTGATGGFTDVAPSGDTIVQRVGTMAVKHATTGEAWFYPGLALVELIGTSAIQDDAVTTAKITDDNVTAAKLWNAGLAAVPTHVSKSIVAADVAALGAVLQGQIDFDAALPAGAVLVAAWIEKGTDWSGGAIATMTASLGISGGDVDRYTTPGNIFTGAGAGNLSPAGVLFDGTNSPVPEGAVTPAVDFVATVANLDQLAAGDLIAHLAYCVPLV